MQEIINYLCKGNTMTSSRHSPFCIHFTILYNYSSEGRLFLFLWPRSVDYNSDCLYFRVTFLGVSISLLSLFLSKGQMNRKRHQNSTQVNKDKQGQNQGLPTVNADYKTVILCSI